MNMTDVSNKQCPNLLDDMCREIRMVIDTVSLLRELDFTITEGSMTGT